MQVAIAVPLLVMSGQSLDRLRATATNDLGFTSDLLYAVPLKLDGLAIDQAGFQIRKASDTLGNASGVASVTVADGLPLDFRGRSTPVSLQVDANTAPRPVAVQVTRVGDEYLNTMGIPLVRGRGFTAENGAGAEPVTIVSRALLTQSAVAAGAGGVILLLAALGIYGVVGLMVATRTREIAVRAALGATRWRVLIMIICDVVKLVLPGTIVGVVLTIALNRLNAENMGISLSNAEPIAYVVGPAIAVLVAVLASLAPARRPASVAPMVAMRSL